MSQNFKKTEYFLITIAVFVGICYVLSHYGGVIAAVIMPFALAAIIAHFLSPPAEFLKLRYAFSFFSSSCFCMQHSSFIPAASLSLSAQPVIKLFDQPMSANVDNISAQP